MHPVFKILQTPTGRIILSIIIGFGLASLFRKVCNGKDCIVIKAPSANDINKYFYKIDDNCYKYTPYQTECT